MHTRLQWIAITVALVLGASSLAYNVGASQHRSVTRTQVCNALEAWAPLVDVRPSYGNFPYDELENVIEHEIAGATISSPDLPPLDCSRLFN